MKQPAASSSPNLESQTATQSEKRFHGWRLVGFLFCVIVVIAIASAIVDWAVIGPLEGRAY